MYNAYTWLIHKYIAFCMCKVFTACVSCITITTRYTYYINNIHILIKTCRNYLAVYVRHVLNMIQATHMISYINVRNMYTHYIYIYI